jgi:hypothetical protein
MKQRTDHLELGELLQDDLFFADFGRSNFRSKRISLVVQPEIGVRRAGSAECGRVLARVGVEISAPRADIAGDSEPLGPVPRNGT